MKRHTGVVRRQPKPEGRKRQDGRGATEEPLMYPYVLYTTIDLVTVIGIVTAAMSCLPVQ